MPSASDSSSRRERIFARERAQRRRLGIAARVRPADSVAMTAIIPRDRVSARDQAGVRISPLHPGGGGCGDQRGGQDEANESGHGIEPTSDFRQAHHLAWASRSRAIVPATPGPIAVREPTRATRPGRSLGPIGGFGVSKLPARARSAMIVSMKNIRAADAGGGLAIDRADACAGRAGRFVSTLRA